MLEIFLSFTVHSCSEFTEKVKKHKSNRGYSIRQTRGLSHAKQAVYHWGKNCYLCFSRHM